MVTIGYAMTPADLKTARERLALTQLQLAEALGVHRIAVVRWESGARKVPSMLRLALKALEYEKPRRKKDERKK